MDTCIGLRTAVMKDGTMHVQAGAGIVADSVPQAEDEETRQKAQALMRAAEEAVRSRRARAGKRRIIEWPRRTLRDQTEAGGP